MGEERIDLGLAYRPQMSEVMKVNVTFDPMGVGLFRARAVMTGPETRNATDREVLAYFGDEAEHRAHDHPQSYTLIGTAASTSLGV